MPVETVSPPHAVDRSISTDTASAESSISIPTLLALGLILLSAGLRLLYLLYDCPLDLSPDEGHYWDWSRHLDWSYYSKGPVVAYLIRASCALFGEQMWAVRLPAVLCGSLTLWGLFVLTRRVYDNRRLALGVVALAATLPVFAAGSLLMTIDAPYVCFWTWALVVAQRMFGEDSSPVYVSRWMLLGFLIGVGILAKYTMFLFLPLLGLFLLTSREYRRELVRPGFWLMTAVAGLCCLPILIWNAQHDWVTFLHVGRQAGVTTAENMAADPGFPKYNWTGPLEYLAGQAGLLLGYWFVAWLWTMVSRGRALAGGSRLNKDEQLLWWMSAPMFVIFLGFSIKTRVELNWPITAYISGMVLTAGWLSERLRVSRATRISTVTFAALGLIGTILIHHSEWLYPLHNAIAPDKSPRRWDATCRLRGWQTLAAEVQKQRDRLRAQGEEPIIAGGNWNIPGILAFYLPDHPDVYSLALAAGGRHSQYDFWRPNPISDPEQFRGRTFIYVGEVPDSITVGFASPGSGQLVSHQEGGHVVASWQVLVGRGFKGYSQLHAAGH